MRLFHRTKRSSAARILREGFRDATGNYGISREVSGVWLSAEPLDSNEGAHGDVLLAVELSITDDALKHYEWIEEGKAYREFLVPADVANSGTVSVAEIDCLEIYDRSGRLPIGWSGRVS